METALTEALDPDQSKSKIMRVRTDTGSQRTYIPEEIFKKLKLATEGNVNHIVFTFGACKPKEIIRSL